MAKHARSSSELLERRPPHKASSALQERRSGSQLQAPNHTLALVRAWRGPAAPRRGQSSSVRAWADTQLGKGSRQEGRAQTELPHGQGQKVGTAQVRLIRTIKGCQVPDGEPPLISQSISCAGALSPQKKGRSCC